MKTIFTDRLDTSAGPFIESQIVFVPPISPARIMDPLAMSNVVELWSIPMLRRDLGTTTAARVQAEPVRLDRAGIVGASSKMRWTTTALFRPVIRNSTTLA